MDDNYIITAAAVQIPLTKKLSNLSELHREKSDERTKLIAEILQVINYATF